MIFILGGRGFVGSGFARYCERTGRPHAVIHRENYQEFVGRRCELLVNANGSSSKLLGSRDPLADFEANVASVRRSLLDFQFDHYLLASSCDVYPDCSSPETTREDRSPNPARQSPYGFHKSLAERCVQHGASSWLVLRLGGFVGPGLRKNAIFDLLAGGPLWLDPDSELQFLHTDDTARLAFELVDGSLRGEVLNLCGRGVVRLREVMERIGRDVQVQPDAPRVRYDVSVEKAAKHLELPATRDTVLRFVDERLAAAPPG